MSRHRPAEVRADGRWFRRSDDRWYDGWGAKWWWWWRRSSPSGVDRNGVRRHAANGGRVENNNTDVGSFVYAVARTEGQRKSLEGITQGGHRYNATTGTILEMTEPPNNYHHQQHHHQHHHLLQQEQQNKNHNHHHQLQLRREGNISSTGRSFGSDSDNSSDSGNGPVAANDGTRFSKFITSIKYAFGSHNNNNTTNNGGPRTDDQNIEPSSSSSNSSTRPLVIKFSTNQRSSTVAAGEANTTENTGDDRGSMKRTAGTRRNRSSSSSLMNGFKIL